MIIVYGVGMLLVGWYYSRKMGGNEDYLLGGRNMKPSAVGLSLFATLFSSITYLSVPGEMVRYGPIVLAGLLAYPLIFGVAGWFLIPVFMRLQVTSGYELLEVRLGPVVRMVGVVFFLALRLMWMAVIVYATANTVLVPLTGMSSSMTPVVCAVLAIITIIYTSMGGLKAVVATDVVQTLLLLAGAVLSLVLVTYSLGSVGAWWPHQWNASWGHVQWLYDPAGHRSVIGAFVATAVWYICTTGSDQMAIQRYLATRDAAAARKMLGVSLFTGAATTLFLAGLGLALFTYFSANPKLLPQGATLVNSSDRLFPMFIVSGLPQGVSGLIIAGLLAAAMSSLSSGINSMCAVVSTDLLDRFGYVAADHRRQIRRDRIISILIGAMIVGLSMGVGLVYGNLLEIAYKLVNLLVAPLFGLFFMAIFVRWATAFGTLTGALAGLVVVVVINYWRELSGGGEPPVEFLWAMPLSLLTQITLGMLASLLPIGKTRPMLAVVEPDSICTEM